MNALLQRRRRSLDVPTPAAAAATAAAQAQATTAHNAAPPRRTRHSSYITVRAVDFISAAPPRFPKHMYETGEPVTPLPVLTDSRPPSYTLRRCGQPIETFPPVSLLAASFVAPNSSHQSRLDAACNAALEASGLRRAPPCENTTPNATRARHSMPSDFCSSHDVTPAPAARLRRSWHPTAATAVCHQHTALLDLALPSSTNVSELEMLQFSDVEPQSADAHTADTTLSAATASDTEADGTEAGATPACDTAATECELDASPHTPATGQSAAAPRNDILWPRPERPDLILSPAARVPFPPPSPPAFPSGPSYLALPATCARPPQSPATQPSARMSSDATSDGAVECVPTRRWSGCGLPVRANLNASLSSLTSATVSCDASDKTPTVGRRLSDRIARLARRDSGASAAAPRRPPRHSLDSSHDYFDDDYANFMMAAKKVPSPRMLRRSFLRMRATEPDWGRAYHASPRSSDLSVTTSDDEYNTELV